MLCLFAWQSGTHLPRVLQSGMFYNTIILLPGVGCLDICIHMSGSEVPMQMLPVIIRARKGHPQVIKTAPQIMLKRKKLLPPQTLQFQASARYLSLLQILFW